MGMNIHKVVHQIAAHVEKQAGNDPALLQKTLNAAVDKAYALMEVKGVDLGDKDTARKNSLQAGAGRFAASPAAYTSQIGISKNEVAGMVLAELVKNAMKNDPKWAELHAMA